MARQALAAHAVRVAQRDGAAVHIQAIGGNAQLVAAVDHLHGKGFVQLPQVDVADLQAELVQHLGHGEHRADAHFVRLTAGDGEAEETAHGLQVVFAGVFLAHHHAGARAVAELAGVAGGDQPAGQRGFDAADAFLGRAFACALVLGANHFLGAQAHHRVGDAGHHGDGCDLVVELARRLRRHGLLLAAGAVFVHRVATDVVAFGHLLGGLQHAPVDGRHLGFEVGVFQHVQVHLLLHATDALHTAGDEHIGLAGNDALRGQRDGLQARRAEAIHGHARGGDGAAGHQRDLAADVHAGGAFGVGAAHDDVVDGGKVDAGTFNGVLDRVAAERGAMGHVEGTLPALGKRRAGGGNDHGGSHGLLLVR